MAGLSARPGLLRVHLRAEVTLAVHPRSSLLHRACRVRVPGNNLHHVKVVVVLDSTDADSLADFWAGALHYRRAPPGYPYVLLSPGEGRTGPELLLQTVPEPKTVKNRMHLDIRVPHIEREEQRLVALGARRLSPDVMEEHGFRWIVMSDPERNEFCVCREPS